MKDKHDKSTHDMFSDNAAQKEQFLKELLGLLEENADHLSQVSSSIDCRSAVKGELTKLKLMKEFGVVFPSYTCGGNYIETTNKFIAMSHFQEGDTKTISWSDDGRQPHNEWLMVISFPTGPYVFSQEYPSNLFNQFFAELKAFEPKYCDSANKSLYFDATNARVVFEAFDSIFNKYKAKLDEELRNIRKAKLQAELAKLEEQQ